jgi:site-specific DNA-adenine methylase
MKSNILLVNDLDRHIINLARVVRTYRLELQARLDNALFHPDELLEAQVNCKAAERIEGADPFEWAYHYFIASWMTRGGSGGARGEFDQKLSIRYKSGGGDSAVRFRSAVEALTEWEKVMQKCTFITLDCFKLLDECLERDSEESGVYADPPWFKVGDAYRHTLGPDGHAKLRDALEKFQHTRICVRYGDCAEIRELYKSKIWTFHEVSSKKQSGDAQAEVLITTRCGGKPWSS